MISNDSEELYAQIRDSVGNIQMPAVDQVVARGRALRRRRTGFAALTAVGVVTAASLAMTSPSGAPTLDANPTADVHLHLAAWSVDTNPDRTVTVTLRELYDSQKLAQILAKAGVRAKVQFVQVPKDSGSIGCWKLGHGLHALPSDQVISRPTDVDRAKVVTIAPAAMPAGSVLSFVVFGGPSGGSVVLMTLYDGEPGTCMLLSGSPLPVK